MMRRQRLQRKHVAEETNSFVLQRAIDMTCGVFSRGYRRSRWPVTRYFVYFRRNGVICLRQRRANQVGTVKDGRIVPIGKWRFRQEGQRLVPCAGR